MARLQMIVEGQTEQAFAVQLLAPHLLTKGVYLAKPQLAAHARRHGRVHRGGIFSYAPFRNDCVRRLREDNSPDLFLSTMIDLYGLPRDFPDSQAACSERDPYRRVSRLEKALAEDIGDTRFIAYLQLHEFEAMLLAEPHAIAGYFPVRAKQVGSLVAIAANLQSPELVDDGENTAPSKQIGRIIPDYVEQKNIAGPIIAEAIGLPTIRKKCPHFDAWLGRIEQLGAVSC